MNSATVAPRGSFLAWPGWAHLLYATLLGVAFSACFALIYGGVSWLTGRRQLRVPIHSEAELALPLLPWMLLLYMSLYLLFLASSFIVRERREYRALVAAQAFATVSAGVCFLLIPSETVYPPPQDLGSWAALYQIADRLNLDYNNLPSLHVAFSVICVTVYARRAGPVLRLLLWTWAAGLSASTVLTHQHHLVDVPGGWLLAWAALRYVHDPLLRTAELRPGSGKG